MGHLWSYVGIALLAALAIGVLLPAALWMRSLAWRAFYVMAARVTWRETRRQTGRISRQAHDANPVWISRTLIVSAAVAAGIDLWLRIGYGGHLHYVVVLAWLGRVPLQYRFYRAAWTSMRNPRTTSCGLGLREQVVG